MPKKVIQVPVDERLLGDLNAVSRRRGQARSEFIREACQRYLREVEHQKMDEIYREGYRRVPEEPAVGQTQSAVVGQVLTEESW